MSPLRNELKQSRPFESVAQEAFLSIVRTAGLLTHQAAGFLRTADLSMPLYNILRILRGAGGTGLTCREIGERLVSPGPDVTRLLDRLESHGWIRRERGADDRRCVTARITPEGRALVDRLHGPLLAFHEEQLRGIGVDRLRTLIALLEDIRLAMREPGAEDETS